MFERPSLRRAPGQRLLSVHHFVQRLLFFAQSPRLCVVGIAHCNANNGAIIDDGPFLHFFIPISIHLPIDLRQLHYHSKMLKSGAAQTRRSRFWALHGSRSELRRAGSGFRMPILIVIHARGVKHSPIERV